MLTRMDARVSQLVFDCHDPRALARFWADLFGGEVVDRGSGWSHVDPPGFPRLAFQPVPEGKAVKNRLHLDIDVGDIEAGAAEAVSHGARRLGDVRTDEAGTYQVMLDPEGNEFCLCR